MDYTVENGLAVAECLMIEAEVETMQQLCSKTTIPQPDRTDKP